MAEYVWIDLGNGRQGMRKVKVETPPARSHLSAPMVVSDQIEIKSMVNGEMYTSKRALRQSYRANGYAEVGNEVQKIPAKPKPNRKKIRESIEKSFARVGIST